MKVKTSFYQASPLPSSESELGLNSAFNSITIISLQQEERLQHHVVCVAAKPACVGLLLQYSTAP